MHARAIAVLLAATGPLGAQGIRFVPRVQPEVRAELTVARRAAAVAMTGANVALGYYVRAGAAVGAGVADAGDGAVLATRADATFRFLLDPFAEHRWGPYAGGGLTVRRDGNARAEAGVLFVLGVEAKRDGRWTPAFDVTLGQGARFAVVLRRSRRNGR
jgi:hypothetical protein